MGLESPHSQYSKLQGADTLKLTRELRQHGIKLLGSTIVGLEHHTPENIHEELEHAVAHDTDFHQFMLYTPVPGTPLFAEMTRAGAHAARASTWPISTARTSSTSSTRPFRAKIPRSWLDWAFRRDFERNGPSIYRICRTTLEGWLRYKNDPDPRVRARFAVGGALPQRRLRRGAVGHGKTSAAHQSRRSAPRIRELRMEVGREFGLLSRVVTQPVGPVLLWSARREERRLLAGDRLTSRAPSSNAATGPRF
jgi:hypothetical protein